MIPLPVAQAVSALARREGATLFMALLAVYNVLLSRYSGQEDVVVGSPIAGRDRSELEGLIGFFVNTLVLRTDLSGAPGFRELLAAGSGDVPGGVRASGVTVREAGGGAKAGTGVKPQPAVPDDVRPAERTDAAAVAPGPDGHAN